MKEQQFWNRTVAALFIVVAGVAVPVAAMAETYTTEIYVFAWPEKTWDFLREFCYVAVVMGEPSRCVEGGGGVGSIRLLADGTQQQLLERGELSYTYKTINGLAGTADYQATIEVQPVEEPLHSKIVATITWNEQAVPPAERLATRNDFRQAIERIIDQAKQAAEAS